LVGDPARRNRLPGLMREQTQKPLFRAEKGAFVSARGTNRAAPGGFGQVNPAVLAFSFFASTLFTDG
jgi:hypothetical protein